MPAIACTTNDCHPYYEPLTRRGVALTVQPSAVPCGGTDAIFGDTCGNLTGHHQDGQAATVGPPFAGSHESGRSIRRSTCGRSRAVSRWQPLTPRCVRRGQLPTRIVGRSVRALPGVGRRTRVGCRELTSVPEQHLANLEEPVVDIGPGDEPARPCDVVDDRECGPDPDLGLQPVQTGRTGGMYRLPALGPAAPLVHRFRPG